MARVSIVKREHVPEQFREAFDALTAESGGVIASGPGSITINSPEMARRRNHLTSYLRYETTFPKSIQELAIITTARAMDCPYVWNAHAPAARRAGVSDALIDALRERRSLPPMNAEETAVVNYAITDCPQLHQWGCSPPFAGLAPASSAPGHQAPAAPAAAHQARRA
jgi:4-carboxymuconolactone decarboxylase